jgi:hypothetical protein
VDRKFTRTQFVLFSRRAQIPVKLILADGAPRQLLLHARRGESMETLRRRLRRECRRQGLDVDLGPETGTHALVMRSKSAKNPHGAVRDITADDRIP